MKKAQTGYGRSKIINYGQSLKKFTFLFLIILLTLNISACGLWDKIEELFTSPMTQAINVLDDAIQALESASADWQAVLKEAQAKLTKDAQSTIRNEIANVASRSIAQVGVELRCNTDFIRQRVRQALIRIRAKLLNQEVPPAEPGLCQIVPLAVDRELVPQRLNKIEFYGYDFDITPNLKVFHEQSGRPRDDVTRHLDRPTHYAMTLKFGPTGVGLSDRSVRFVLEWNAKPISTIAVIQPATPVCESRVKPINPSKVDFIPPRTRGDKDFHGHGPKVTASVSTLTSPDSLRASIYMRARETKSDWTTAEGSKIVTLYTPDPGWKIDRLVGETLNSYSYTDSDHGLDSYSLGSGGPVNRFEFIGDTDGDDAGVDTKVTVFFNTLRIEETQTGNCVSARAVESTHSLGLLKDSVYQRLRTRTDAVIRSLQIH